MSMKIYKGFVIAEPDFYEILKMVLAFGSAIDKLRLEKYQAFIRTHSNTIVGRSEWFTRRDVLRKSSYRDPAVDTDFSLVLFPRQEGKLVLGVAYVESDSWFQAWLQHDYRVSEYGYWDNTDGPDDIPVAVWRARYKEWNAVLPGTAVPSTHGFAINVGQTLDPAHW